MLIGLTSPTLEGMFSAHATTYFPSPQNLNFVRVKQALWQQGRGFWHIFQEGPEKFFERSAPMGQKSFWEEPEKCDRFIVTADRKTVALHRICVLWGGEIFTDKLQGLIEYQSRPVSP